MIINTSNKYSNQPLLEKYVKSVKVCVSAIIVLVVLTCFFVSSFAPVVSAEEAEQEGNYSSDTDAENENANKSYHLSFIQGLIQNLKDSFTGSRDIVFTPVADEVRFVENDELNFLEEIYFPNLMGRVVIPSIGTHSPLYDDANNFLRLIAYGAGIVPLSKGNSEDYIDSIYLHRVLTKTSGSLYLDEMQNDEPFYVDNYRTGLRNYYHVVEIRQIPETQYLEEYPLYLSDYEYAEMRGPIMMLVTCEPFIYGSSEERILVYGEIHGVESIPEDDPLYSRYRKDNNITLEEDDIDDEDNAENTP